jgi:hypothetical protein
MFRFIFAARIASRPASIQQSTYPHSTQRGIGLDGWAFAL